MTYRVHSSAVHYPILSARRAFDLVEKQEGTSKRNGTKIHAGSVRARHARVSPKTKVLAKFFQRVVYVCAARTFAREHAAGIDNDKRQTRNETNKKKKKKNKRRKRDSQVWRRAYTVGSENFDK